MRGLLFACLTFCSSAWAETLSHGRFEGLVLQRPAQVRATVLLLAGEQADLDTRIAAELVQRGALVVTIDTAKFLRVLESDGAQCVYPSGDLENLSRFVQAYAQLATYTPPIMVGTGTGAALTYAVLAQAPAHSFTGGISLDFCADLPGAKKFCERADASPAANGARFAPRKLDAPWTAVQTRGDSSCGPTAAQPFASSSGGASAQVIAVDDLNAGALPALRSAFDRLVVSSRPTVAPAPRALDDLPIVEVPAVGDKDALAVLLSGDGGWAGIDKQIASALAARGIPVVGVDSLRYFWKARTPQSTAADIDRLIAYYVSKWRKRKVVLIGYSQGADVLPFVVNRLPPSVAARVSLVALLGLGQQAQFEFHVSNWLSAGKGLDIAPELQRIGAAKVLCIYGSDETDSLCPQLSAATHRVVRLPGGHHFGGDYERLSRLILDEMGR